MLPFVEFGSCSLQGARGTSYSLPPTQGTARISQHDTRSNAGESKVRTFCASYSTACSPKPTVWKKRYERSVRRGACASRSSPWTFRLPPMWQTLVPSRHWMHLTVCSTRSSAIRSCRRRPEQAPFFVSRKRAAVYSRRRNIEHEPSSSCRRPLCSLAPGTAREGQAHSARVFHAVSSPRSSALAWPPIRSSTVEQERLRNGHRA